MFSHVMLGANNIEESKEFYDQILEVLGARPGKLSLNHDGHTRYVYFVNNKNSFVSLNQLITKKLLMGMALRLDLMPQAQTWLINGMRQVRM